MAEKSKKKSKGKRMKKSGASTAVKEFFSGGPKKVILKSILALVAVGLVYLVIMTGVLAVRLGHISMDSLYQNIERSSTLYDIKGEQIEWSLIDMFM